MKLSALLMAGGKGTRLKAEADVEKPLLELDGRFLIDYIIDALDGCEDIGRFWAVTSTHTKQTEKYLKERSIQVLRTPGNGYVKDMVFAIKKLGLGKTLVVSSDLPLLTSEDLRWVIREYRGHGLPALTVMIPIKIVRERGIRPDTVINGCVPSGVNFVDGKNLNGSEFKLVTMKSKFAVNINTQSDFEIALRMVKHAN